MELQDMLILITYIIWFNMWLYAWFWCDNINKGSFQIYVTVYWGARGQVIHDYFYEDSYKSWAIFIMSFIVISFVSFYF